ncbi:MAG: DUF2062 domain-containing protein, partial [Nanoarchaeota archaeon]|nr:DUF2062 domain-containing protein [Nanoarchaeota archaeon]
MIKQIKLRIINFYLKLKNHFLEILKLKTSPHEIALGFAIGTFIEILPTFFGIDYMLALIIILIYPKISKISLFGALLILNFIILTPIHLLNYYIGNLIYAGEPIIYFNIEFWDNLINISRRFLIGSLITAPIISLILYIFI